MDHIAKIKRILRNPPGAKPKPLLCRKCGKPITAVNGRPNRAGTGYTGTCTDCYHAPKNYCRWPQRCYACGDILTGSNMVMAHGQPASSCQECNRARAAKNHFAKTSTPELKKRIAAHERTISEIKAELKKRSKTNLTRIYSAED